MQEEELKAYQGLKKQGAFLLKSPRFGLGVVSTKLPNLTVIIPFKIPVSTKEYLTRENYMPEKYKGRDPRKRQIEYCCENSIKADPRGVIIFRRN